jgi:hypothetical protein
LEKTAVPAEVMRTLEHLVDVLHLHLWAVEDVYSDGIHIPKYRAQAYDLMYKIPICRPVPRYIINLSDLPETIRKELESLAIENQRGLDISSRQQPRARKYYHKEHVLFQRSRRNLAVTIDPEIVDRYGSVAGLDSARFHVEGEKVTITFTRRRGAIRE